MRVSDTPEVREEYEALLQFLYMAPIGLLQAHMDGSIVLINPLCAQLMMPLVSDGKIDNLFDAFESVAPDLRQRSNVFAGKFGKIVEGIQIPVYAGHRGRRDGQVLSLTILKLDAERLMAVINDVTEVVRRERQLRHTQAWIETIVSGISDYALLELDSRGCIRDWNVSVERLLGFTATAIINQPFSFLYPPDACPPGVVADRLAEALQSGWSLDEGWRVRGDGSRFWSSTLITPIELQDADENGFSLIVRDISEGREAREALRSAVLNDHLTGLANRRAFHEAATLELQRWVRQPRHLSLLLIDADHFKRINDEYGHATGDAALRHLAAALGTGLRGLDVVARLGGEEFVALLPGTDIDDAETLAMRLCERIARSSLHVDGREIRCTVSIGVATMTTELHDVDGLLQRADRAMYAAKNAGRNRVARWSPQLADQHLAASDA
jgi:diguanylate cyclase (GGDEF)-like protein/PAS domain S-box-containing protein